MALIAEGVLRRRRLVVRYRSRSQDEITERVAAVFTRAKVPCRISENLIGELWTKLVWNCALNALSALGKVTYGEILASGDARVHAEAMKLLAG